MNWIRRKFHSQRLFTKLILLYSVLIVFILIIMSLFFYSYHRKTFETVSKNYNAENLSQIQYNVENNLRQIEQLSMILVTNNTVQKYMRMKNDATDPEIYDTSKEVERLTIDIMVTRKDIESITIYTDYGNIISTNYSSQITEHFSEIYHQASQLQGKLTWVSLDPSVIAASRIIYDAQTLKPTGILIIQYRQSSIKEIVNGVNTTNFLLNEDNQIIVSPHEDITEYPLDIESIATTPKGEFARIDLYGQPHVTTLVTSQYNGWKYISATPESLLNIDAKTLILLLTFTLLFSSVLGVVFSIIIAREITKPLQRLTYYLQDTDIEELNSPRFSDKNEFSFLFASYNHMLAHIQQLITQNYEQKLLQNEMELKILHMQINPHFLYNALDTVYYVAIEANQTQIAQIIDSLAKMMRYSLSGGGSSLAKVLDEVHHAENYCAIQKIRMGDKIEYYFDIVDELLNQPLPRLTLQPFVENCIRHGWKRELEQPLFVEVIGYIEGNCCVLEIKDDGKGITPEAAQELHIRMQNANFSSVHGVAIPNINAQIKKSFGIEYGVSFIAKNEHGGATFIIKTPYPPE